MMISVIDRVGNVVGTEENNENKHFQFLCPRIQKSWAYCFPIVFRSVCPF